MIEQSPEAIDDGEAEAEAAAPFARRVVELVVLLEDRLELVVGYADQL